VLYAILHHLNLQTGFMGAFWNRVMIRRMVFRKKRDQKVSASGRKKRPLILPSNAQVLSIALVGVLSAVLCVIGADYIAADTSTWDLGTSFSKRGLAKRAATTYATPLYNIDKEWWTSGARFGLIAFALFPLVVVLALKQPPAAILSIRQFTHLYADKLQLLHRWVGRLIWLLTALHVALWSVRLFKDQRSTTDARSVWIVIWIYDKFQWAVVGFVAMTALILLSTNFVRKRAYEVSGNVLLPKVPPLNPLFSTVLLRSTRRLVHLDHAWMCPALSSSLVLDRDCSHPLGTRKDTPIR
jgi:hypothetical protein